MAQIWIEIEENGNCGYFPVQVFEVHGEPEVCSTVEVDELPGSVGPQVLTGWCSKEGGSPCPVTVILVGDSGAGESRLVRGGDHGLRIKPLEWNDEWSLDNTEQRGEPYVLLDVTTAYRLK